MGMAGVERKECYPQASLYVLCYNVVFVMNEMRPYAGSPSFGSLGTFSVSLCNRTFSSALPALGGSGAAPPLKASAFLFFLHFHLPLTSILSDIAGFIAFCCRQILLHTFFFFFFF